MLNFFNHLRRYGRPPGDVEKESGISSSESAVPCARRRTAV